MKEVDLLKEKPSIEKRWLNNVVEINKKIPNSSLYDYVYENNKNNMNNIAFQFFDNRITYEEFFEHIDEVACNLKRLGVEDGDVVPLIMANIPESAYCFYALNKIGAVSCMIDPRLNEYGLMRDLNLTESEILISVKNAAKNIKKIQDKTKLKEIIMLSALNSAKNPILKGIMNLNDLRNGNRIYRKFTDWNKFLNNKNNLKLEEKNCYDGKPAAIVFTGGTTGVHKGVLLSNNAINTTVYEHNYLINNVEKGEKFLDILPPFIAYGLTSLHLSLCFGLETILDPTSDPKLFAKKIIDYRPSIVFGGPIHWEAFIQSKKIKNAKLDFLKYPVSGGEKLQNETLNKINEVLKRKKCSTEILDGYGASEMCGVFSLKFGSKNSKGTVGFPLRFNNMCILDLETKEEKGYNESGEICISGPSVMNGYYKNEEENNRVFITDAYGRRWLKTGDLGMINENGELIITGRLKRIFVCGVNKVYPPEMEELIMTIPGVRKCVVTGVNDEKLRTVPKVHMILENNYLNKTEEIEQKIINLISEKICREVLPKYYSYDDEFLYTGSGKIDYVRMANIDNEIVKKNSKILVKKR